MKRHQGAYDPMEDQNVRPENSMNILLPAGTSINYLCNSRLHEYVRIQWTAIDNVLYVLLRHPLDTRRDQKTQDQC